MDPKIVVFSGAALFVFFILVFLLRIIINYQKNNFNHNIEKQKLQSQFSQTLLESQLEIREQTLQHIARELHDNLGQIASLIKINLNTLQLDNSEKSIQKIESTKELTRQLIADLKSLSVSLNGDRIIQLGLLKSLEEEVDHLNKTGQFSNVSIEVQGDNLVLDRNSTIILYRMVQEMINNIVKHSQASVVRISFIVAENLFSLIVTDNGVGFNIKRKLKSGGSGLQNLYSRAKLIEAQLTIESSPVNGTSICIDLPLLKHVNPTTD